MLSNELFFNSIKKYRKGYAMFKIRYKSHHDVGNIISKFTQNLKASKNDFRFAKYRK